MSAYSTEVSNDILVHLCELFIEEFENDSLGLSDWLIQADAEPDDVVHHVRNLYEKLR